jgi:hypothetical protein
MRVTGFYAATIRFNPLIGHRQMLAGLGVLGV